MDLGETYYTKA